MLAIVFGTTHFKYYLYYSKFIVTTEHTSLQYMLGIKDPSSRILRWHLKLTQFDYTIVHRSGKKIGHADALIRYIHTIRTLPKSDIVEELSKDPVCQKLANKNSYYIENSLIMKKTKIGPRIVLPASLLATVLQQHHDSITAVHCGRNKINQIIRETYSWPTRSKDTTTYNNV
jgi:hypothetical protein